MIIFRKTLFTAAEIQILHLKTLPMKQKIISMTKWRTKIPTIWNICQDIMKTLHTVVRTWSGKVSKSSKIPLELIIWNSFSLFVGERRYGTYCGSAVLISDREAITSHNNQCPSSWTTSTAHRMFAKTGENNIELAETNEKMYVKIKICLKYFLKR